MKKTQLLNSELSYIISKMGHTDTICIGDAGLPVPQGVQRIDLAIVRGIPAFLEVLEAVLSELAVEEITVAAEIETQNPALLNEINKRFEGVEKNLVPHAQFKDRTKNCVAVVRTGECKSYANIILHAGVAF